MHDLGVLCPKLTFVHHIDYIIAKAYFRLGFIMNICSDFNDPLVLKSLYFSYVRSHLEFASVLWFPNQQLHIDNYQYLP